MTDDNACEQSLIERKLNRSGVLLLDTLPSALKTNSFAQLFTLPSFLFFFKLNFDSVALSTI